MNKQFLLEMKTASGCRECLLKPIVDTHGSEMCMTIINALPIGSEQHGCFINFKILDTLEIEDDEE